MDTKEKRFESDIESYMLSCGGFTKGDQKTCDREKAIDLPKLISFVKKTQPRVTILSKSPYRDAGPSL